MPANDSAGLTPKECVKLLAKHRHRWMTPALICTVLAAGYSLVMSRYWQATQGLVVRQEVSSSETGPLGKFPDLYQMRSFQETILELAKSRQVISATIQRVAERESGGTADPATDKQVEKFRKRLTMLPPGGAEFGKTEVFYLGVEDTNRERAIQLVGELSNQLDNRLRELRDEKSQNLVDELREQVNLATAAQQEVTNHLLEFEANVGADLGELRMLHSANSGQSDLRQRAVQLEQEFRQEAVRLREAETLHKVLSTALSEPDQLVALPNSLLASQPTLTRLKNGLFDAQLRLAEVRGTRTSDHPKVQAAREGVEQVQRDLHRELEVAADGVMVELDLSRQRHANLQARLQQLNTRLSKLAGLRAEYSNRVAAVENSRLALDEARKKLTEARAQQAAAATASLVTPIDRPDAGTSPVGMRRAGVVLLGGLGGLIFGLGWTFLTVTPPTKPVQPSFTESARPAAPVASSPARPVAATAATAADESKRPKYEFPAGVTYTPYGTSTK